MDFIVHSCDGVTNFAIKSCFLPLYRFLLIDATIPGYDRTSLDVNTTVMEVLVNLDLSLRMNIALETMLNDHDLAFIFKQDSLPRTRGTLTSGIENLTLPNVDGQYAHCPVQNYNQF